MMIPATLALKNYYECKLWTHNYDLLVLLKTRKWAWNSKEKEFAMKFIAVVKLSSSSSSSSSSSFFFVRNFHKYDQKNMKYGRPSVATFEFFLVVSLPKNLELSQRFFAQFGGEIGPSFFPDAWVDCDLLGGLKLLN